MFSLFFAIFGAILGSFTTMLIYRLHFDESGILTGRSKCPSCNHQLAWFNLFPIFSWIFQRGKCSYCTKKISCSYPLTELLFAIVFFIFTHKYLFSGSVVFIPILIAVFFSLILFMYDLKFMEVDDRVAYPAILLAIIWSFFREESYQFYFIGGSIGFLFYAAQYYLSKGRWVGFGDLRLGLFMGLCLGWEYLIFALFLSYIFGMLVAIPLLLTRKKGMQSALPMGAFLMPALILFLYDAYGIEQLYWKFIVTYL